MKHSFNNTTSYAVVFLLLCSFWISSPSFSEEKSPREQIQEILIDLQSFVRNNADMPKEKLDAELDARVRPLFDFREMSRRALAANWNKFSSAEQDEFVDLYSQLLARTYIARIRDDIRESKFEFPGEKIKGELAIIDMVAVLPDDKVHLSYRLIKKDSVWKAYDVVIENIGLIGNYRDEFAGLIRKDGVKALLDSLRKKVAEGPKEKETKPKNSD